MKHEICAFHLQQQAGGSVAKGDMNARCPGRTAAAETCHRERGAPREPPDTKVGETNGSNQPTEAMQRVLLLSACDMLISVVNDLKRTGMREMQWALINRETSLLMAKALNTNALQDKPVQKTKSKTPRTRPGNMSASPETQERVTRFASQLQHDMESTPERFHGLSVQEAGATCLDKALTAYCERVNRPRSNNPDAAGILNRIATWL